MYLKRINSEQGFGLEWPVAVMPISDSEKEQNNKSVYQENACL